MSYKERKLGFACCQLGMQHVCQLPWQSVTWLPAHVPITRKHTYPAKLHSLLH